jgi:hypothetical protein
MDHSIEGFRASAAHGSCHLERRLRPPWVIQTHEERDEDARAESVGVALTEYVHVYLV